MPHLLDVGLKRPLSSEEAAGFPFTVPAVRTLPTLDLEVPVTLFVGENGSGKSTLLEGSAGATRGEEQFRAVAAERASRPSRLR